jgi:hypothetical protein
MPFQPNDIGQTNAIFHYHISKFNRRISEYALKFQGYFKPITSTEIELQLSFSALKNPETLNKFKQNKDDYITYNLQDLHIFKYGSNIRVDFK